MERLRIRGLVFVFVLAVAATGCDFLDPARPTIQPDTEVFGNVLDLEETPDAPGSWTVHVRVGPPRALAEAEAEQGREGPDAEGGLTAEIRVDGDTLVLLGGEPARVTDFSPGTEVVGIPVPGTTRMVGDKVILINAQYFSDFTSYRNWRLPRLRSEEAVVVTDPSKIDTAGIERGAVPLDGGHILYFTASFRRAEGGRTVGAERAGLVAGDEGRPGNQRSYRTELADDGWTAPALVEFPNLDAAQRISVSWVSPDETECLVTVVESAGAAPWAGRSRRGSRSASWGEVEPLDHLGEGDAFDPVYLAGSRTKVLFVTSRLGGGQTDLFLYLPPDQEEAQALEPRINTIGREWGPRVGANNELFFSRGDRQLVFQDGMVRPVVIDWPHRILFSEAAPTADDRWVFLTLTRLRPGEPDLDLAVSVRREDGLLGFPVPVDEWRPTGS